MKQDKLNINVNKLYSIVLWSVIFTGYYFSIVGCGNLFSFCQKSKSMNDCLEKNVYGCTTDIDCVSKSQKCCSRYLPTTCYFGAFGIECERLPRNCRQAQYSVECPYFE